MVSKNENLEYLTLSRRHKLDPSEPSELTLTLDLDESEAKMVFQCIFDRDDQIDEISNEIKTLDITIFWDKDPLDVMYPKFTLPVWQWFHGSHKPTRAEHRVWHRRHI